MAERCHGGTKTVAHGTSAPKRLSGFETAVCPERALPDRSYCALHMAEALARSATVAPGAEAGLRWPGVTTGVHVHQRGTYQKLAPR